MAVLLKGPGWSPGKPRLGCIEDIPQVSSATTKPYDKAVPRWLKLYCVVHFVLVLYGSNELGRTYKTMPFMVSIPLIAYFTFSLTCFGLMFDLNPSCVKAELLRLALFGVCDVFVTHFLPTAEAVAAALPPPPPAEAEAALPPPPPAEAAAELPPPPPAEAAAELPPPPPAEAAAELPPPPPQQQQQHCPHRHQQKQQQQSCPPPPPAEAAAELPPLPPAEAGAPPLPPPAPPPAPAVLTPVPPTTTSPAAPLAAATTTHMAPMARNQAAAAIEEAGGDIEDKAEQLELLYI
eukprot:Em0248g4a